MSTTMWKKIRRKLLPKGKGYELSNESDSNLSSDSTIERYERVCQAELEASDSMDRASSPEPISPAKSQTSDLIDLHIEHVEPIRYSTCSGQSDDDSTESDQCRLTEPPPEADHTEERPAETEVKPVKKVAPPLLVPLRSKRKSQCEDSDQPVQKDADDTAPQDGQKKEEVRVPPVCPPRPPRDPRVTSRPLPPEVSDEEEEIPPKKPPRSHTQQIQVEVESHPEPRPPPDDPSRKATVATRPVSRLPGQKRTDNLLHRLSDPLDCDVMNTMNTVGQKKMTVEPSTAKQTARPSQSVTAPQIQQNGLSNTPEMTHVTAGAGTDSGYSTMDEIVAQWEKQKREAQKRLQAERKSQHTADSTVKAPASQQSENTVVNKNLNTAVEEKTETVQLRLVENKTYDTSQRPLSNGPLPVVEDNMDVNKNISEQSTTSTAAQPSISHTGSTCLADDLSEVAAQLLDNRKSVCMPLQAEQNGNVPNVNVLTTNKIKPNTKRLTNAKGRPVRNLYAPLPQGMPKPRETVKNSLDSEEDEHESLKLDEAVGPVTPEADEENNELDSGTEMGLEYYEHEEVLEEVKEEEDGYLPPIPSRNYHDYGQMKVDAIVKKTLKVHISQLDNLEPKEPETNLMSSDSGTEESSPSALSLSGSESKDVEPTHMTWDEVMQEAQNLGIPLVKPAVQDGTKSPCYSGRNLMTSSMTSSMMSCDTLMSLESCRSLSSSSDYHLRLHSPNSDCTKPPSPCSSSDRSSDYLDCNRYARSLPSPGPTGELLTPKTEKRKVPLKEKFKLQNFFHKKNKQDSPKMEKHKAATLHVDVVQRRKLPATPGVGRSRDQDDNRSMGSYGRHSPSPSLMRQFSNSSNHSSLQSPSPHLSPTPHSPQRGSTPCSPHVMMPPTHAGMGPIPAPLPIVPPIYYPYHGPPSSPSVGKNTDFICSLKKLKDCGWYWGPLNWDDAETKLSSKPDGSFLVRDSSDDRYILSLSFRSQAMTHHTRIEHYKGMFSFYSQPKSHGASTIVEFIEKAMEHSRSGKFLYFLRPRAPGLPPAPVQLLYPISRFRNMHSLQHVCRFVILKSVRKDHIDRLPVPPKIKGYLQQSQYYTEYYSHEDY